MRDVHLRAMATARGLERGTRWSAARVVLDVALVIGLAACSELVGHPAVTLLAILLIGAFPLHDVLVHGHEAIHGLASRSRRVNAALLWCTHALVGLSGRAHRAFHLDHHRFLGTADDPERRLHGGGRHLIVGVIRIVGLSHAAVNGHAWRGSRTRITGGQVAADLVGAALLHAVLLGALGPRLWLLYLVLPATTGLPVIAAVRALTEHLAPRPEDLVGTRASAARRVGQVLWSNVDHHVEHHLGPQIPWHRLPALRERLAPLYAEHGVAVDHGLFRTAWRVLGERAPRPTAQ